ncbi:hypothetical protein HHX47_DHR9000314, partial [Lentinula edodes]
MHDTYQSDPYHNCTESKQLMSGIRRLPPLVPRTTYYPPIEVPINPQLPPILLGERSRLQHDFRLP